MTGSGIFQLIALLVVLAVTAPLLGRYLAAVYGGRADGSAPGDRSSFRSSADLPVAGRPENEQRWTGYAFSLLAFSAVRFVFLYAMQRVQEHLPLNPTNAERWRSSPRGTPR